MGVILEFVGSLFLEFFRVDPFRASKAAPHRTFQERSARATKTSGPQSLLSHAHSTHTSNSQSRLTMRTGGLHGVNAWVHDFCGCDVCSCCCFDCLWKQQLRMLRDG